MFYKENCIKCCLKFILTFFNFCIEYLIEFKLKEFLIPPRLHFISQSLTFINNLTKKHFTNSSNPLNHKIKQNLNVNWQIMRKTAELSNFPSSEPLHCRSSDARMTKNLLVHFSFRGQFKVPKIISDCEWLGFCLSQYGTQLCLFVLYCLYTLLNFRSAPGEWRSIEAT